MRHELEVTDLCDDAVLHELEVPVLVHLPHDLGERDNQGVRRIRMAAVVQHDGELEGTSCVLPEARNPSTTSSWRITGLKYLVMIVLYIEVICIVYGTVTFQPPAGTWPGNKVPPVSPSVACTMIISCMYFLVYTAVQCSRIFTQLSGSKFITKFGHSMMFEANAMNFAPMLSVLFIGARMRALQAPVHSCFVEHGSRQG